MESIGEKLRVARESRRMTVKDVVKETNINPIYITALEEEKFDKFPSETYVIGFLRSYAEFLKLDVEEIVQSYKGYKIGESVTPLEELTRPTKSNINIALTSFINKNRSIIFIAAVTVVAIFVIWGFKAIFTSDVDVSDSNSIESIKDEYSAKNGENNIDNLKNLQLTNNSGFISVYRNEAVQFMVDNKEVVFLLKDVADKSVDIEILPGRKVEKIEMDSPKMVSIEGCPREVTFILKGLTPNRAKILVQLGEKTAAAEEIAKKDDLPVMEGDNTSVVAQNKKNLKLVFEAQFTQKSFVELYLDGVRKQRGFVMEGSVERWEATEYIQVKIGNAGGLNARINGKSYSFGKPGQVANKIITWKKDVNNPNLYHVVVKDW